MSYRMTLESAEYWYKERKKDFKLSDIEYEMFLHMVCGEEFLASDDFDVEKVAVAFGCYIKELYTASLDDVVTRFPATPKGDVVEVYTNKDAEDESTFKKEYSTFFKNGTGVWTLPIGGSASCEITTAATTATAPTTAIANDPYTLTFDIDNASINWETFKKVFESSTPSITVTSAVSNKSPPIFKTSTALKEISRRLKDEQGNTYWNLEVPHRATEQPRSGRKPIYY